MEQRIARIISYLIHPGFIPFYITLLLVYSDPVISLLIPARGKLMIAGIIFFTTILLPFLSGWVFFRLKMVSSLFPQDREERIYLLLNAAVFYFLGYYLLKGHQALFVPGYFLLGSTILVVCSMIIGFFYRISLHMTAAGGILGGTLWMSFENPQGMTPILVAVILFTGITGTLRLIVKPDNPGEVWFGLLTGMAVMVSLFAFA